MEIFLKKIHSNRGLESKLQGVLHGDRRPDSCLCKCKMYELNKKRKKTPGRNSNLILNSALSLALHILMVVRVSIVKMTEKMRHPMTGFYYGIPHWGKESCLSGNLAQARLYERLAIIIIKLSEFSKSEINGGKTESSSHFKLTD